MCTVDTPSQRVKFLLGTEDDDEEHVPHDLFTEMDELCIREGEDSDWKETARYVKLIDCDVAFYNGIKKMVSGVGYSRQLERML